MLTNCSAQNALHQIWSTRIAVQGSVCYNASTALAMLPAPGLATGINLFGVTFWVSVTVHVNPGAPWPCILRAEERIFRGSTTCQAKCFFEGWGPAQHVGPKGGKRELQKVKLALQRPTPSASFWGSAKG